MKIEHLIFDLDNTLYSGSEEINQGITERMYEATADFFKTDLETARKLRHERVTGYSTTLEWLRAEGLTDIERFFAIVHPENEMNQLNADEKLRPYLESIKIPKTILTNSPREHAERVLKKLKVQDLFEDVCDIRDCGFLGKPYKSAFDKALEKCGGNIENTVFIDDMQKYTDGWKALGGTAILIGEKNGRPMKEDSAAVWKGNRPHEGNVIRVHDVYGIKEAIKNL